MKGRVEMRTRAEDHSGRIGALESESVSACVATQCPAVLQVKVPVRRMVEADFQRRRGMGGRREGTV